VNGRNVLHLAGGETVLHDGDEFLIMTPLSGG
jgi:molybdopterin converting factor small subunit